LKKIIQEFAQGKRKTLIDFIRFGAHLIRICPIEISNQKAQEKAQQLLQMDKIQTYRTKLFFAFLHDQVDTRNLALLEMIYDEFLQKKEDILLYNFVQFAAEVMSIIPSMKSHQEEMIDVDEKEDKVKEKITQSECSSKAFPVISTCKEKCDLPLKEPSLFIPYCDDEDEYDDDYKVFENVNDQKIRIEFQKIEALKPWQRIFDVNQMIFSFFLQEVEEKENSFICQSLKEFWIQNAQAVWERWFWAPYPIRSKEYAIRQRRQVKALYCFSRIVKYIFTLKNGIGIEKLWKIENQTFSCWWYRSVTFGLKEIYLQKGWRFVQEYLNTQRFDTTKEMILFPPIIPDFSRYKNASWRVREKSFFGLPRVWYCNQLLARRIALAFQTKYRQNTGNTTFSDTGINSTYRYMEEEISCKEEEEEEEEEEDDDNDEEWHHRNPHIDDDLEEEEEEDHECTTKYSSGGINNPSQELIILYEEIEKTKPWKKLSENVVLQIEKDKNKYDKEDFFDRLSSFWSQHGRAIWERNFWAPYKNHEIHLLKRKRRQNQATQCWENLIVFFIQKYQVKALDLLIQIEKNTSLPSRSESESDSSDSMCFFTSSSLVIWWWYRTELIQLKRIWNVFGKQKTISYLNEQKYKRWPQFPIDQTFDSSRFFGFFHLGRLFGKKLMRLIQKYEQDPTEIKLEEEELFMEEKYRKKTFLSSEEEDDAMKSTGSHRHCHHSHRHRHRHRHRPGHRHSHRQRHRYERTSNAVRLSTRVRKQRSSMGVFLYTEKDLVLFDELQEMNSQESSSSSSSSSLSS
jgi:hypothetical protein